MRFILPALTALLLPMAAFAQTALPPGHPPIGQMQAAPAATHQGKVLETLAAQPYSYVHVTGAAGDEWLAGPAGDFKVGSDVRWSDGMVQKNFHSRTLNRDFDSLTLVDVIEPVK